MSALAFLGTCVVLALGGFDPAPLLIAAVYMAARPAHTPEASRSVRRTVFAFGTLLIGGTVVWGVTLSLLFGQSMAQVHWEKFLRAGAWAAGVELAAGLAALGYAAWRWRRRHEPPQEEKNHGPWGLMAVALGFVALVTTDPPFIVAIGLSGSQPLWAVIVGHVLWAVVSQLPLFVLCLAVLANKHRKVAEVVGGWWARIRPLVNVLIPLGLALVGALLVLDAAEFFVLGRFMIAPHWGQ